MNTFRTVEIIGGGLAGLSLGLALRRHDVPVTVYEAGEYPRHRVCGEFITGLDGATVALLDLEPLLRDALRHTEVAWFAGDAPPRIHVLPHAAYGISRHVLDLRLSDAFTAAGGRLLTRTRVADLALRPGRIFATGRRRGGTGWLGLKVHAHGFVPQRELELHLGEQAYVGVARIGPEAVNICGLFRRRRGLGHSPADASVPPAQAQDPSASQTNVLFQYLDAAGLNRLADRLRGANVDHRSFCSVAALQFDLPQRLVDRIALGDAYAMIPPFTGNGMAIAFQSAALALPHVLSYARGETDWPATCRATNAALARQFRLRLASADLLHPFLLRPEPQRWLRGLSRAHLLPFRTLYRVLH